MKIKITTALTLMFALFITSCSHSTIDEPTLPSNDSLYFSATIDGKLIQMDFKKAVMNMNGISLKPLSKIADTPKEEIAYGYVYGYSDANYYIELGFSKRCILDTLPANNMISRPTSLFKEVMEKSSYAMQLLDHNSNLPTSYKLSTGFYIRITDTKTSTIYSSTLIPFDGMNIDAEFLKVSTNSGLTVLKSVDQSSQTSFKRYLEGQLKCKMYKVEGTQVHMVELTNGVLKGEYKYL